MVLKVKKILLRLLYCLVLGGSICIVGYVNDIFWSSVVYILYSLYGYKEGFCVCFFFVLRKCYFFLLVNRNFIGIDF